MLRGYLELLFLLPSVSSIRQPTMAVSCVFAAASATALALVGIVILKSPSLSLSPLTDERHVASPKNVAVVRPVSPHDVDSLLASFDLWADTKFPPCEKSDNSFQEHNVDLIISFSRTTDETRVLESRVSEAFERTSGWNNCFARFFTIDCGLTQAEDKYNESLQTSDVMWVNGPNAQVCHPGSSSQGVRYLVSHIVVTKFRRTFAAVKNSTYETFYFMEADSYPQVGGWLDLLLHEIEQLRPFGILGSKYKGNVWDSFIHLMPVALVEHINGNAIYNVTDTLLNLMVDELERESDGLFNAVAYDYRLSQLYFEAAMGITSTFPFPELLELEMNNEGLEPKMAKLFDWWVKYGYEGFYSRSNIIGNYGLKGVLDDIGSTSIVHGKQYNPMNPPQKSGANEEDLQSQRELKKDKGKRKLKCSSYHPNCIKDEKNQDAKGSSPNIWDD
jgi:hypothetical protein